MKSPHNVKPFLFCCHVKAYEALPLDGLKVIEVIEDGQDGQKVTLESLSKYNVIVPQDTVSIIQRYYISQYSLRSSFSCHGIQNQKVEDLIKILYIFNVNPSSDMLSIEVAGKVEWVNKMKNGVRVNDKRKSQRFLEKIELQKSKMVNIPVPLLNPNEEDTVVWNSKEGKEMTFGGASVQRSLLWIPIPSFMVYEKG
ncbi:hypothetical protein Tco_0429243 [Tanacetum coccineum]